MEFKHRTIYEDMDYRDHVVDNCKEYVDDFLNVFSKPILQYVGQKIMGVCPVEVYSFENKCYYKDYAIPVVGQYYMFIAAKHPGDEKEGEAPIEVPQWNALRTYTGEKNSTLQHFVSLITVRHFNKIAAKSSPETPVDMDDDPNKDKEVQEANSQKEIFCILKKIIFDQESSNNDLSEEIKNDLLKALNGLRTITPNRGLKKYRFDGEKDYKVLYYSFMCDYNWEDIAEELQTYFEKSFSGPLQEIPDKEKREIQTRISQWKIRAILHLTDFICQSDKFNCLKSAIIQHRMNNRQKK